LVSYAFLSGQTDSADILDLIGRHVNWTGFWEINWLRRTDPAQVHSAYRELVALYREHAEGLLAFFARRTLDGEAAADLTAVQALANDASFGEKLAS